MPAFSPAPAYIMGTSMLALGLFGLAAPAQAHELFGLPLASTTTPPANTAEKTHPAAQGSATSAGAIDAKPSPFVAATAARDIGIGITYVALQAQGLDDAVTTVTGAVAMVGWLDAAIVWRYGGTGMREKALGHALGSSLLAGLVAWRLWHA